MQKSHKTLKASFEHILALNLASSSNSTSLLCFRGGLHRLRRWVLCGRRRVVWGSQVAAWDIPEQLALECLSVGLLGHNLDLVV